jgi:uncharacterized protein YeaO (DUF488 family)
MARFRSRYRTELKQRRGQIELIKNEVKQGRVTLIYGSRDQEHNEAVVLKQFLTATSRLRSAS